jgi:hypothetical protein
MPHGLVELGSAFWCCRSLVLASSVSLLVPLATGDHSVDAFGTSGHKEQILISATFICGKGMVGITASAVSPVSPPLLGPDGASTVLLSTSDLSPVSATQVPYSWASCGQGQVSLGIRPGPCHVPRGKNCRGLWHQGLVLPLLILKVLSSLSLLLCCRDERMRGDLVTQCCMASGPSCTAELCSRIGATFDFLCFFLFLWSPFPTLPSHFCSNNCRNFSLSPSPLQYPLCPFLPPHETLYGSLFFSLFCFNCWLYNCANSTKLSSAHQRGPLFTCHISPPYLSDAVLSYWNLIRPLPLQTPNYLLYGSLVTSTEQLGMGGSH